MLLSVPVTTSAQSASNDLQTTIIPEGLLNVNNLDNLGDGVEVKDLSYEEAVVEVAALSGVSEEKVRSTHEDKTVQNFAKGASTLASNTWIKQITIVQDVGTLYKPELNIFVWYYSSGSFAQFNDLFDVQFDLSSHRAFGPDKSFQGTTTVKVQTPISIYWAINGHFYDLSTTTWTGGIEVGNGKYFTATATVSRAENHFKYWYNWSNYNIQ